MLLGLIIWNNIYSENGEELSFEKTLELSLKAVIESNVCFCNKPFTACVPCEVMICDELLNAIRENSRENTSLEEEERTKHINNLGELLTEENVNDKNMLGIAALHYAARY